MSLIDKLLISVSICITSFCCTPSTTQPCVSLQLFCLFFFHILKEFNLLSFSTFSWNFFSYMSHWGHLNFPLISDLFAHLLACRILLADIMAWNLHKMCWKNISDVKCQQVLWKRGSFKLTQQTRRTSLYCHSSTRTTFLIHHHIRSKYPNKTISTIKLETLTILNHEVESWPVWKIIIKSFMLFKCKHLVRKSSIL